MPGAGAVAGGYSSVARIKAEQAQGITQSVQEVALKQRLDAAQAKLDSLQKGNIGATTNISDDAKEVRKNFQKLEKDVNAYTQTGWKRVFSKKGHDVESVKKCLMVIVNDTERLAERQRSSILDLVKNIRIVREDLRPALCAEMIEWATKFEQERVDLKDMSEHKSELIERFNGLSSEGGHEAELAELNLELEVLDAEMALVADDAVANQNACKITQGMLDNMKLFTDVTGELISKSTGVLEETDKTLIAFKGQVNLLGTSAAVIENTKALLAMNEAAVGALAHFETVITAQVVKLGDDIKASQARKEAVLAQASNFMKAGLEVIGAKREQQILEIVSTRENAVLDEAKRYAAQPTGIMLDGGRYQDVFQGKQTEAQKIADKLVHQDEGLFAKGGRWSDLASDKAYDTIWGKR